MFSLLLLIILLLLLLLLLILLLGCLEPGTQAQGWLVLGWLLQLAWV
jgi:hypothetical protein